MESACPRVPDVGEMSTLSVPILCSLLIFLTPTDRDHKSQGVVRVSVYLNKIPPKDLLLSRHNYVRHISSEPSFLFLSEGSDSLSNSVTYLHLPVQTPPSPFFPFTEATSSLVPYPCVSTFVHIKSPSKRGRPVTRHPPKTSLLTLLHSPQ